MNRNKLCSYILPVAMGLAGMFGLTQCDKVAAGEGDEVAQLLRDGKMEEAAAQIRTETAKDPNVVTPHQLTTAERALKFGKGMVKKGEKKGKKIVDEGKNKWWPFGKKDDASPKPTEPETPATTFTLEDFKQAARCADADKLELILKQNNLRVTIDTPVDGLTPLMWAARQGQEPSVSHLLDMGADAKKVSDWGYTALMYAACNGDLECVKELTDKSEVDARNPKNGLTALMDVCLLAEAGSELKVINELMDEKADRSCCSLFDAYTPVMLAAHMGKMNVLEKLNPRDGDIRQKDAHGLNSMDHAERGGHQAVAKMLESRLGMPEWAQYLLTGLGAAIVLVVVLLLLRYFGLVNLLFGMVGCWVGMAAALALLAGELSTRIPTLL